MTFTPDAYVRITPEDRQQLIEIPFPLDNGSLGVLTLPKAGLTGNEGDRLAALAHCLTIGSPT